MTEKNEITEEIDYTTLLEEIYQEITPLIGKGKVADYIPELGRVAPDQFGMAICLNNGIEYVIGSADKSVSVQSVSKVYTLAMAYKILGDELWGRLGREPSGSKFNSLILLERELGIPRNPFLNSGAIVVADMLMELLENPIDELKQFVRDLSGNPNIDIDENVRDSELDYANVNYALTYFMKSFGNINGDVANVIRTYTSFCSLEMSCVDLARSMRILSQAGLNPWTKERILTKSQCKRINAIMVTCGLYNGVGEFAYRVGLPAKSGVGGCVVGIIPGEMSIAVWSPGLDKSGNSLAGIKALELFTTKTGKSIF
jgi:glutaminase